MSKYLVLYHSEGALNGPSVSEMFSNPPEQLAAGMVGARQEKCGNAIIALGAALDKSTTVTAGSGFSR